ncbi:titin-like isoform X2 [Aedes albopictus]|uniref:non-specific serine/threonine protein kinase n=1 Tax=Aedes albopictus TaxID=7160 RepID=A0ABM1ZC17_AEDAL
MPLYSELYYNYIGNTPVIPTPLSSTILPSSNYTAPSYVGVSRGFQSPIIVGRTPSFTRGYVPKLTPITETPLTSARVTALTRANSSKFHPHTSPTYQKPRRVINTADIDVSASRYVRDHTPKRFLPSSPTSSFSSPEPSHTPVTSSTPDPTPASTTTSISAREQELMERVEQRRQRSTINRNRAVVRLNTMRARSKSRGSRGSTERKTPHHSPEPEPSFEEDMLLFKEPQSKTTSWRDQFRDELSLRPKKSEPAKSPGELLLEKHLIREGEDSPIILEQIIATSPVMMRRGTIRRKSAIKIPSFHEICEDINSDKLDDDLNAGELRRRASQIIEDEIAQFQQELQESNGLLGDDLEERIKEALEQQTVESVVEVPEKKKQKKFKRTRTKPLPKIDLENNVVYDQVDAAGNPLKITMDSPVIESSAPPKLLAEVESIEECTVFKLPKKKKLPEDLEVTTPPKKASQKITAKTIELETASPAQKIEVLIIDLPEAKVASLEEPTRKLEQPKPLTEKKPEPPEKKPLGSLAERKKILERQRKMDKLAKLTERRLPPVEAVPAVTAKTSDTKTENNKQDAAAATKEEIKPMEKTEQGKEAKDSRGGESVSAKKLLDSPKLPLKKLTQEAREPSPVPKVEEKRKNSSEESTVGVKNLKAAEKVTVESPKPTRKAVEMAASKTTAVDADSQKDSSSPKFPLKKLTQQPRESSPVLKTKTEVGKVESKAADKDAQADGKLTADSPKSKQEETKKLVPVQEKDVPLLKQTPEQPQKKSTQVLLDIGTAAKTEVKPKETVQAESTEKPNTDSAELKKATPVEPPKPKPLQDAPKHPFKKPISETPEPSPTPKPADVFKVPEVRPASPCKKPAPKQPPPVPDLPSDLTPPPTPTKPLKKTPVIAQEPPRPESPKAKPSPPSAIEAASKPTTPEQLLKAPPPPAEPPKPKPLLKPITARKRTANLNLPLSPEQQEEDFWSNIGTRETVSFARRKQNIERRNQMVLLKFAEQQEEEDEEDQEQEEEEQPEKTSKNVSTKVMTSPPAAAIADMPQWPKPIEEAVGVARKAFEVTPVRLDEVKKAPLVEQKQEAVKKAVGGPKEAVKEPVKVQKLDEPKAGVPSVMKIEAKEPPKDVPQLKETQELPKAGFLKKIAATEMKEPPKDTPQTKEKLEDQPKAGFLKKTVAAEVKDSQKDVPQPKETQEPPKVGFLKKTVTTEAKEPPKDTLQTIDSPKGGILGLKKVLPVEPKPTKEPLKTTEELLKTGLAGLKKTSEVEPKDAQKAKEPIEEPKAGFLSPKKIQEAKDRPNELPCTEDLPKEPPKAAVVDLKKTAGVAPKEPTKEQQVDPKGNPFGLKKTPEPSPKEPAKVIEAPEESPKKGFLALRKKIQDLETKQTSAESQKPPESPKKLLSPSPPNSPKKLIGQKLSPKELIKSVAPTIAAEAEKKLAQVQKTPKKLSPTKEEKPPQEAIVKPEVTPKEQQPEPQAAVEPKPVVDEGASAAAAATAEPKKTKIVKKVIKVVKPKAPAAPQPDAAKVEAEQRRIAQENAEKIKAKVNQITLNMGAKLDVEIKDCAKCQQATLTDTEKVPAKKPINTTTSAADSNPKTDLAKNKFGAVSNLSSLSTATTASDRSVTKQVLAGADQQSKQANQVIRRCSSSSSSEEEEEGTASETSFSGIEDDWSSEEEEMANDKAEKKKFDPQKRVKLSFEQMRKCYSKEEKCPIVLVARPRPLWKVKRHGHRHNRHADLTSSSSGSEDESGSATDQTSSETASTVDASSDLNTDSSINSSRGPKGSGKKKQVKSGSKTSDVGSDIYDNPMVIPLHSEPKGSAGSAVSSRDENNNDNSGGQLPPNEEDGENDKNAGNHEVRSTSTSSHDSGFYGGGTAPISPKKAMETSYTYAQFQKTGKLTAPATVIPRFRKYNVDDFHFLTVLGKGSFGKVFLAELRNTEYYYAVKCLKKDVVLEDDDVDCTLIERKVLALGTKHPFLCHLFCTFQTDSHLFFVMEYLNGGDLMFHIQQSGRFQEARAKFYAAEIVSGLKFLHRKGIVYRDLKLDNVLLDYDGHVRIADFGMCKLEIYLDRLADSFCGTPDYMAPEIIKGQKYNQAVDWWSFGVLVYEMLVGQSPFSGCDEDELFWSICNEIPWFPHFLSKDALKLLQSLLEKDATIRLGCFNTMDEDSDIKYHPFFESIDWQKLERRGLEPPFKPQVRHPLDTQYFDKQFTRERARLTPIDRNILASMNQGQFEGFTYTNPNNTLTTPEITYHPIRQAAMAASRHYCGYRRPYYY